MPRHPAVEPDADLLPEADAARLLARASELDAARGTGATVADLRAAAAEAGISARAFEAALAEIRGARRPPPAPARAVGVSRGRRWAIAVALAGLVAAGALAVNRGRESSAAQATPEVEVRVEVPR